MKIKEFTPLVFLAALGAGGIAVMPFVLMQYTIEHGEGLITRAQLWSNGFSGAAAGYYYSLEGIMIVFTLLHIALSVHFGRKLFLWMKSQAAKEMIADPLRNAALLAPLISILMTMNLFIGPIRYFIPWMSSNFQSLFMPAMIFWSILFVIALLSEIYLLGVAFRVGFDINKISFGWLLHPFMLGMLTTVGTGIAAMAKDPAIANTAAFMSLISGSMGAFLLIVKLVVIFKSHFAMQGLPEKHFLPSFLIVIPNVTLYAISAFRFGKFLEHQHGFEMGAFFFIVMGLAFAFEIWYMLFGVSLMVDYFRKHHFKEFYVTQWGFICPLVAFVVLGAFAYNVAFPSGLLYGALAIVLVVTIAAYFELLFKHYRCATKEEAGLVCPA